MIEFLKSFLIQAHTDDLKTKDYPKQFLGLKMKVSFGMGMPARVPWIAFLAPGMSVSSGYYPVYLYYKEQDKLILAYGISETNPPEVSWNEEILNDENQINHIINNPVRYGNSFVFSEYKAEIKDKKVSILKNHQTLSDDILQDDLNKIINDYKKTLDIEIKDENSTLGRGLFFLEQQLEDFLIENWTSLEFSQRYDLIFQDGELKSQQYKTDVGIIDILAVDKKDGALVVIELKKNQTSDAVMGQILRYMGWIKEKNESKKVKGVIVAGHFDERLYYAQLTQNNIDVYLYELDFKLKEFTKN